MSGRSPKCSSTISLMFPQKSATNNEVALLVKHASLGNPYGTTAVSSLPRVAPARRPGGNPSAAKPSALSPISPARRRRGAPPGKAWLVSAAAGSLLPAAAGPGAGGVRRRLAARWRRGALARAQGAASPAGRVGGRSGRAYGGRGRSVSDLTAGASGSAGISGRRPRSVERGAACLAGGTRGCRWGAFHGCVGGVDAAALRRLLDGRPEFHGRRRL